MSARRPLEERFWAKVDRRGPGECWLWTGCKDTAGYGLIGVGNGKSSTAHRVSWKIATRSAPTAPGVCVLHRCDVRHCVNPAHLFLGTHTDNMRDMAAKRRGRDVRGEANPSAALTTSKVQVIRFLRQNTTLSLRAIGELFGVGSSAVDNVVTRNRWAHVPDLAVDAARKP